MASCFTERITTLVLLLANFGALPMVGWAQEEAKPYFFDVTSFTPSVSSVATTADAVVENGFVSLTSSGAGIEFCPKLVCLGRVLYRAGAKVPEGRGISFNTKFTFAMMKSRAGQVTGDGFVFFIGQHPYFPAGQPNGMFGLFTENEELAERNEFFGIEFDTMKNIELDDQDDNHLGVDLSSAFSAEVAPAGLVNVQLNDGQKIVAWIDYYRAQNRVEARISYDQPGVLKPTEPLLTYTYDLNYMEITEFWAGFSSSSNFGFEQRHLIYDWEFNAKFDSFAPALNETVPSSRLAAYTVGGVVALGITWYCVVKFSAFGKKLHAKCIKGPNKIQVFVAKLCKEDEDEGPEDDVEKTKPAAPTTTGGDDDNEDEEDAAPATPPGHPKPGARPGTKPPPPKGDNEDDEEEDEEEDEDDDDNHPPGARMFLPPPPPPPMF